MIIYAIFLCFFSSSHNIVSSTPAKRRILDDEFDKSEDDCDVKRCRQEDQDYDPEESFDNYFIEDQMEDSEFHESIANSYR